jgi:predicted TIM-barrel fold metal-dependent hydrolase
MTPLIDRRSFLAATATGIGAALAAQSPAALAAPKPRLVDAHLHCFAGSKDSRFPYHERAPYRPDEPATPEQLIECMDGAGVDFAIVVHPEPYQDDHRYLDHCLAAGKGRLKGTLLLFADREGSVEKMPDLAKRLDVVAARIHAYAPERLPPFGKPKLRGLWKQAADLGLAVQLHFEPRYATGFEPLIKEFAETRVIVDHLGRPLQGTPEEHAVVVRWSRFDNVVMKFSSLSPSSTYPHRDLKPIVKELASAYGADRLIYGGGFGAGATPESYRAALDNGRSYIAHLGAEDQAKIMGENAVRLFGFR